MKDHEGFNSFYDYVINMYPDLSEDQMEYRLAYEFWAQLYYSSKLLNKKTTGPSPLQDEPIQLREAMLQKAATFYVSSVPRAFKIMNEIQKTVEEEVEEDLRAMIRLGLHKEFGFSARDLRAALRSEARRTEGPSAVQRAGAAPGIRKELRDRGLIKTFRGPRLRALPLRWGEKGYSLRALGRALERLGVPNAHAALAGALSLQVRAARLEEALFRLGALASEFPPRTDAQPSVPRALYDYRGFSAHPEDYLPPLLLAAADKNLKVTLWLKGAGESDLNRLRQALQRDAASGLGAYPRGNFRVEPAPDSSKVLSRFAARVKRDRVPSGLVSSEREVLPPSNAIGGAMLAHGSSESVSLQNLTGVLLAKRLLDLPPDRPDPDIHTGPELAGEGRWSELMADIEGQRAREAAA